MKQQRLYCTVKNFGGKKLWRIRTVVSLVEKLWQIEVHLHREFMEIMKIGKNLGKMLYFAKFAKVFFTANVFYCMLDADQDDPGLLSKLLSVYHTC